MPSTPSRSSAAYRQGRPDSESDPNSGRWIGWTVYAVLALTGFCFGAWAGNQRPAKPTDKPTEVAKASPGKEGNSSADNKPEPKPTDKPTPESPPKKEPVAVVTPKPMEPKTPEVVTPEPKKPEPKKPESEPKKPEPEPKKPEPKPAAVKEVSFAKEIVPIFRSKCLNCHGAVGKPKGDLDLRNVAAILKGGDNGPGVKPGDLKNSLVWKTIDDGSMPPDGKEPLTAAEKKLVENWILSGAKP